jgi:homoserine O-succinyltransferase
MLMRGMDDAFYVPQSRYTGLDEDALRRNKELYVVADSEECGSYLILACSSRQIFVTGHSEYDRYDLDKEYRRDLERGLKPDVPVHYYPEDNPEKEPILSWRSGSNCIYSNWLNFVYQETPYDLAELHPVTEDSYLREDHSSERDSTVSKG